MHYLLKSMLLCLKILVVLLVSYILSQVQVCVYETAAAAAATAADEGLFSMTFRKLLQVEISVWKIVYDNNWLAGRIIEKNHVYNQNKMHKQLVYKLLSAFNRKFKYNEKLIDSLLFV